MGLNQSKTAEEKLQSRKEQQFRRIGKKYHTFHSEWAVIIGPPQSGKSMLFNTILDQNQKPAKFDVDDNIDAFDQNVLPSYEKTKNCKMGLKLYDTYQDKYMFPLSLKLIDTPGNIRDRTVHNEFIFQKPTILLICFDYSRMLNRQLIIDWTDFALTQIQNYHPSFTKDRIMEKRDREKDGDSDQIIDDGLYMKNLELNDDSALQNPDDLNISQQVSFPFSSMTKGKSQKSKTTQANEEKLQEEIEKIPPKIIHIFTKVDQNKKFQKINEEIVAVLTRDGFIDQRVFISCIPQELPEENQNDETPKSEKVKEPETYAKFIGIPELKQAFITNKQLISKPPAKSNTHLQDMGQNIKEIYQRKTLLNLNNKSLIQYKIFQNL